ncbi:DNA-binding protein [Fructobacillus pseudoficulneus]|uniref:DNA-binding protein n=1 Tax=Fructobacillus pseudoficulneus TaxID=220714 RepID=A0A3F3GRS4_9LACO|nr:DNA-binding protein [Fructobacillus pseudoficulneus]SEH36527.1 addiction module antidote protein, HigA family [Fructobacillus pseudoficulneus]
MSKSVEYQDLIAFHPGTYVEEIVEELNITQAEFAERLGTTAKSVSKLISGEDRLSNELANKLSKLTGISVMTWLNLQGRYDGKVIEINNQMAEDELSVAKMIDFQTLKKYRFVENKRYTQEEKIATLRELLAWTNLAKLTEFNPLVSYRRSRETSKAVVNSNVTLEIASNQARSVDTEPYNRKKLEAILPRLKRLVGQNADNPYKELQSLLQEAGIILVGMPTLAGASLNGATKKFKDGSVLLTITDRNKQLDIFWFLLFHELGHIYYEDFYSHTDAGEYNQEEKRADKFAQSHLISEDNYQEFVQKNTFTEVAIKRFASENETLPSIVLGRLQKDHYLDYSIFSDLKEHYQVDML